MSTITTPLPVTASKAPSAIVKVRRKKPTKDSTAATKENKVQSTRESTKIANEITDDGKKKSKQITITPAKGRKVLGELSASEVQARSYHAKQDSNHSEGGGRTRSAPRSSAAGTIDDTRTAPRRQQQSQIADSDDERENIATTVTSLPSNIAEPPRRQPSQRVATIIASQVAREKKKRFAVGRPLPQSPPAS
ncbi:hypothetical protein CBS101457_005384 [Exobasidium rhododendri]|nr:hypothetical protein CBS101457_005384 [Exobasidium rhododendri]